MHTISTTVYVDAENAHAALAQVQRADFKLPPRYEWQGHKDWMIRVFGPDGAVLAESDG